MGILRYEYEWPLAELMINMFTGALQDSLHKATDLLSRLAPSEEQKKFPRYKEERNPIKGKETDVRMLGGYYQAAEDRRPHQWQSLAFEALTLSTAEVNGLLEKLKGHASALEESGYQGAMAECFHACVTCLSRQNLWIGRLEHVAREADAELKQVERSETAAKNAKGRTHGLDEYKQAFLNLFSDLVQSGAYPNLDSVVHLNEDRFAELNAEFVKNEEFKYKPKDPDALAEEMRVWIKGDKNFKPLMDRLKEFLVPDKKSTKR